MSVIIPALNEEKYIEDTLMSIKNQKTSVLYEVIVVDGGSVDKTRDIAKRYGAKVIVEKKKGASAARNRGARAASGKYLIFVDSDVILPITTFQSYVYFLSSHPDYIGASCLLYPKQEHTGWRRIFYVMDFIFHFIWNCGSLLMFLIGRPVGCAICMLCSRDAFFKINGFNESFFTLEDHDLVGRLSKIGKFGIIKRYVYISTRRIRGTIFPNKRTKHSLYPLNYFAHTFFWLSNFMLYFSNRNSFKKYPIIR